MDRLLKCPFCGGDAAYRRDYGRYGWFVRVECEICGARTRNKRAEDDTDDDTFWNQPSVSHVGYMWNRRVVE